MMEVSSMHAGGALPCAEGVARAVQILHDVRITTCSHQRSLGHSIVDTIGSTQLSACPYRERSLIQRWPSIGCGALEQQHI